MNYTAKLRTLVQCVHLAHVNETYVHIKDINP